MADPSLTDKLLLALSSGTFTLGQIAAQNNITLTQLIQITSDPEFQDQLEALRRLSLQQTTLTATNYMPRGVQILAQLIHGAELDIDEMRSRARDLIYDKPELFCRWSDTIRKVVHLLARLTKPPTPIRDRDPRAPHLTTRDSTGGGTGVPPVQCDFSPFTSLFTTHHRAGTSSRNPHDTHFDLPPIVREACIPLITPRDDRFAQMDSTLAALESALSTVASASSPSREPDLTTADGTEGDTGGGTGVPPVQTNRSASSSRTSDLATSPALRGEDSEFNVSVLNHESRLPIAECLPPNHQSQIPDHFFAPFAPLASPSSRFPLSSTGPPKSDNAISRSRPQN